MAGPQQAEAERTEAFRQWIDDHVGQGKQFRSPLAWMRAAGLSQGGLDTLKRGRIPKAVTLEKLARAAGEDPVDVLIVAGFVNPATQNGGLLSSLEQEMLAAMDGLSVSTQKVLVQVAWEMNDRANKP